MKMTNQLKFMAAAVGMALAASAQAVVVTTGNTGAASWSELVLIAIDTSASPTSTAKSYFRGLNVQMDTFLPNTVTNTAFSSAAFSGGNKTPEAGLTLSFAAQANDTAWSTFANANNASSIQWGIFGRRAGGTTTSGQFPAFVSTGSFSGNNGNVSTASSGFNNLMVSANTYANCGGAFDSCITDLSVDASLNSGASVNVLGSLASSLGFLLATKDSTNTAGGASAISSFCNSFDCAKWTINSTTGTVIYTLLAAPVVTPPTTQIPLPAAGWLLVSGLAGLIGLQRRKASAA